MGNRLRAITTLTILAAFALKAYGHVEVRENQLWVDGQSQPQIFGAEIQYFRLRGGFGPNLPKAKVVELWNRALDHAVEAGMNSVSFYIPWDFHEYAEGKFDFTGTVDEDGDGQPDYPSRDIGTFLKLIAEHGIKKIMARPGPYINAEWGFLGFGAVPEWFHNKFPNSHMRNSQGQRTKLYDYHNADLLDYTNRWFKAVYKNVLQKNLGPGRPIIFLQIDNETNFQWQSLYNHDYSSAAIARYQNFLKTRYHTLGNLNQAHSRIWQRWHQVQPPIEADRSLPEDQDWYRFADHSIYKYLFDLRKIWESIGVTEPQTLFSLAESYNATEHGLLPNYRYRNAAGKTGLLTVNLYPKTFETADHALLNSPFKADLDVKTAMAANRDYFGKNEEWVLGPEIQGGWWKGIDVTPAARQQTYLTVLGHGLKAFFVYYFNEGSNWMPNWTREKVSPYFHDLLREQNLMGQSPDELPEEFWNELQMRVDRGLLAGLDVRHAIKNSVNDENLYFDAPLDGDANPRPKNFQALRDLGKKIIEPNQDFLARALEVLDDVALVKDNSQNEPNGKYPANLAAADWTGSLLGYIMNSNLNPRILFGDISPAPEFLRAKVLFHLDTGNNNPRTLSLLVRAIQSGKTVINFLEDTLSRPLGIKVSKQSMNFSETQKLQVAGKPFPESSISTRGKVDFYDLSSAPNCKPILFWQAQVVGYQCKAGKGNLVQLSALFFEDYNSSGYSRMADIQAQRFLLQKLLAPADVQPQIELTRPHDQVVAFGRRDPLKKLLWITLKSGSLASQNFRLKLSSSLLAKELDFEKYSATSLLSGKSISVNRKAIADEGIAVSLTPNESSVIILKENR